MENKKKWYKTWWGIIFLLMFFFPVGLYQMWKNTNWNKKVKWGITAYFILIIIGFNAIANAKPVDKSQAVVGETGCIGPDGKRIDLTQKACEEFNKAWKDKQETLTATTQPTITSSISTPKPTMQPTKTLTPTRIPEPTKKPSITSKKITDKINNLVAEKYPGFEVTIWNKNSDFASEEQVPYEIVINGSFSKTASSCDAAKKTAYYMLETFYKDNEIRPTLSRVMVTIPYYLRVSLGANDGVPMEKNGSFSGPTNFWTVMENVGLGENESGEMKNRTWGNYLAKCQ